ncbi:MAG: hypothetical protein K9M07_02145 [Simkaniaceae bacterium]|nr:hypothetical protein [Simkaniaceae bacterium]
MSEAISPTRKLEYDTPEDESSSISPKDKDRVGSLFARIMSGEVPEMAFELRGGPIAAYQRPESSLLASLKSASLSSLPPFMTNELRDDAPKTCSAKPHEDAEAHHSEKHEHSITEVAAHYLYEEVTHAALHHHPVTRNTLHVATGFFSSEGEDVRDSLVDAGVHVGQVIAMDRALCLLAKGTMWTTAQALFAMSSSDCLGRAMESGLKRAPTGRVAFNTLGMTEPMTSIDDVREIARVLQIPQKTWDALHHAVSSFVKEKLNDIGIRNGLKKPNLDDVMRIIAENSPEEQERQSLVLVTQLMLTNAKVDAAEMS